MGIAQVDFDQALPAVGEWIGRFDSGQGLNQELGMGKIEDQR